MDQQFIEKMREIMLEQKKEIMESLAKQSSDFKKILEEQSSGDEMDLATDVIDRQMLEALNVQDSNRLQAIDNAFIRMQQGKYGICIRCNKEIPQGRLEALPTALMCIQCKSLDERRNR